MRNFETRTYGKWILAGEHAVLRGSPALVFPLRSRGLELFYEASAAPLPLKLEGDHGADLQLLFWGVLERACELKNIKRSDLVGELRIKNQIPVGAGMGASAAFCVAIARWLAHLNFVAATEVAEFARELENLFHGESSGVDIAVAMSGRPLSFVRGGEIKDFIPEWTPKMYISYSGKRGVTLDCVAKVKQLLQTDPRLGLKVDREMEKSVALCRTALGRSAAEGFGILAEGIQAAAGCFQQWGLTEGAPERHMEWLLKNGAHAVKPTGSGGGGYILSLWREDPPAQALEPLISCF